MTTIYVSKTHRAVLEVFDSKLYDTLKALSFRAALIAEDSDAHRYLYPGMIIAQSGSYYVPYSPTASYGTGSDTAVGILPDFVDATLDTEPVMEPGFHGRAIEAHCYVLGGAVGTVPDAVKTALSDIYWL